MGILVISIISMTAVAFIRTVERAMSLNVNKNGQLLTSLDTGVRMCKTCPAFAEDGVRKLYIPVKAHIHNRKLEHATV